MSGLQKSSPTAWLRESFFCARSKGSDFRHSTTHRPKGWRCNHSWLPERARRQREHSVRNRTRGRSGQPPASVSADGRFDTSTPLSHPAMRDHDRGCSPKWFQCRCLLTTTARHHFYGAPPIVLFHQANTLCFDSSHHRAETVPHKNASAFDRSFNHLILRLS